MSEQDPDKLNLEPEALYRKLPEAVPPPELDHAVLQHAAARSVQPGVRWDRIGRRFATAAVVVLAVGIYLQTDNPIDNEISSAVMEQEAILKEVTVAAPAAKQETAAREETAARLETAARQAPAAKQETAAGQEIAAIQAPAAREETAANQEPADIAADVTQAAESEPAVQAAPPAESRARTSYKQKRPSAFLDAAPTSEAADIDFESSVIEEAIVTARINKDVMASSYDETIFSIETCTTEQDCAQRIQHDECSQPFEVPVDARNFAIEEDVIIYTLSQNGASKDYFVRCLRGTWTTQSQDAKQ